MQALWLQTAAAVLILGLIAPPAAARLARSATAKSAFARANPCPATDPPPGRCPGYEIDHIMPLCAGGDDHPSNMQWLAVPKHRQKTRYDVSFCRAGSTWRMP